MATECANPSEHWQSCRQVFGGQCSICGEPARLGESISNSCCHQHIFLHPHGWAGQLHWKPELPGNHRTLSKALESVAKAKLFLSFLSLCVYDVWGWAINSFECCLSSNGSTVKLEPRDLQELLHPMSLLGNSCHHRRDPGFIFRLMRSKASRIPG